MIASQVRDADRDEFAALLTTAEQVMSGGLQVSSHAWTGLIDDVPVCMFGVAPVGFLLPEQGRPWMVGTTQLDDHAILFLRRCRGQVKVMLDAYPYLINYVATFNIKAIAWLQWLGFTVDFTPRLYGADVPFYRFELRR